MKMVISNQHKSHTTTTTTTTTTAPKESWGILDLGSAILKLNVAQYFNVVLRGAY